MQENFDSFVVCLINFFRYNPYLSEINHLKLEDFNVYDFANACTYLYNKPKDFIDDVLSFHNKEWLQKAKQKTDDWKS